MCGCSLNSLLLTPGTDSKGFTYSTFLRRMATRFISGEEKNPTNSQPNKETDEYNRDWNRFEKSDSELELERPLMIQSSTLITLVTPYSVSDVDMNRDPSQRQWEFWCRGTGWRYDPDCDVTLGSWYWIFEPGFLKLTPFTLANSLNHTNVDVDVRILLPNRVGESILTTDATCPMRIQPIHSHIVTVAFGTMDPDSNRPRDRHNGSGSGSGSGSGEDLDADYVNGIMAELEIEPQYANAPLSKKDYPPVLFLFASESESESASSLDDPLNAESESDSNQLQSPAPSPNLSRSNRISTAAQLHFLHAYHSLRTVSDQLHSAGACWTGFTRFDHATRQSCTGILPFILPWPCTGGDGDDRPIDPESETLRPRLTRPAFDVEISTWDDGISIDQPSPYDIHDQLSQMSEATPIRELVENVGYLSSSIRGCPWPISYYPGQQLGSMSRRSLEQRLVIKRLWRLLGMSDDSLDCYSRIADFSQFAGRRPIHQVDLDRIKAQFAQLDPPVTVWDNEEVTCWSDYIQARSETDETESDANASLRPLPDSVLNSLAQLLPYSLFITFGQEHFSPYPSLVVGPLAPGWIGGFIYGETQLPNR